MCEGMEGSNEQGPYRLPPADTFSEARSGDIVLSSLWFIMTKETDVKVLKGTEGNITKAHFNDLFTSSAAEDKVLEYMVKVTRQMTRRFP